MRTSENRLKALTERQKAQRTFSRIVVIHELPVRARIVLLKNLGISINDNRKITNQNELERIEKLPEDEWLNRLGEAQARILADYIAECGGREAQRRFVVIADNFKEGVIDESEYEKQVELFFEQLDENQRRK